MPYSVRKSGNKFQVVNKDTGKVHAYGTTKAKAEAQLRLLNMIEHGKRPKKK